MSDLDMSDLDTAEQSVPRRHRRRRRRTKRLGSFVAVVASMAVIGGLLAGLYYGGNAALQGVSGLFSSPEDYPGPGTGEVTVTIESGSSLRAMGATLADADVVASQEAFVAAAERNPDATGIQPGTYVLAGKMNASDAVAALVDGDLSRQQVTVPEGYRVRQTVERLAEQSEFTVEELQAAVDSAELPSIAEGDPEGILFPATYDLGGSVDTPEALVGKMISRFDEAADTVGLADGASALDRTPREIVTIASIVQREVQHDEDMARVADVVYSRLSGACTAEGIPEGRLQMDSTVHYALDDYSSVYTTDEMRQSDSPYNTYRVSGLPPGPISSPGEKALHAALNPSHEGNCYFVAVNLETGETKFAQNKTEHDANIAELRAYCRESDLC